jgi:cyclophilin family peptidyl-prolyl cis-trans isomerase
MRLIAGLIAVVTVVLPQNRALLLTPDAPEFAAPAPERSIVRFETSKGDVVMEVFRDWAPIGSARFINLVRYGYFDENRFFRVNPGRWIQWGVNGDPAIATAWRTRNLKDDPFNGHSNVRGTVAFAFAVKDGRTTQVFINLGDNSATHDTAAEPFVPFGRVTQGMDIVDSMNAEYREGPGGIRAGRQDAYFAGGNAYLSREFPRLDFIKRATIATIAR